MQDNVKMDTLIQRIEHLKGKGYENEFKFKDGKLTCDKCGAYGPAQIRIDQFYRFEGESDPGDMTVLYAIETEDGKKGYISDGFGIYATEGLSDFLKKVEELHKGDIY